MNKRLTTQVKRLIKRAGADLVGIASVDRFKDAPKGHRPTDILPSATSVIVFAKRMLYSPIERLPHSRLEYTNQFFVVNSILNLIGYKVGEFLESKGYRTIPIPPAYPRFEDKLFGVLSHRHAAVEAGLGEIGLSNLLITPQYGPRVRLDSVVTDAPLIPDPRFEEEVCEKYQEKCGLACVKACPVNALNEKGELDKFKCLHNQEKILNYIDPRGIVGPRNFELRCGICIAVCPIGLRR